MITNQAYNWREDKILLLMQIFDDVDSSLRLIETDEQAAQWQPGNEAEKKAFESLTADENRIALREWYRRGASINPHADRFRQILAKAIGEDLPVG
jgi:inorganic triphosphatase YgiF